MRGKRVVVAGLGNRLAVFFMGLMPHAAAAADRRSQHAARRQTLNLRKPRVRKRN